MYLRVAGTLLAGIMITTSASAALINSTIEDLDDGLLDTDTNLEWLDLTVTQGLSYNEAEALSIVTGNGFEHATVDQVDTLFVNAGFVTTDSADNTANDPAAALLLDLMGCTLDCGTDSDTGRGFADFFFFTFRPYYQEGPSGGSAAVFEFDLFSADKDLKDPNSGHFLVREAVVSVPEPSIIALLGVGLIGLGFARRRIHGW